MTFTVHFHSVQQMIDSLDRLNALGVFTSKFMFSLIALGPCSL